MLPLYNITKDNKYDFVCVNDQQDNNIFEK